MATGASTENWTLLLVSCVALSLLAGSARAEGGDGDARPDAEPAALSAAERVLAAFTQGKPSLDMRLRWEAGDIQTFQRSSAITLRTRLGFGTKPLHGVSAFVEMENVAALQEDYFNGVGANPNRETIIADPELTQMNRAWAKLLVPALDGVPEHESSFKIGRQRIIFDDSRFVGNVGWRQNEQTFDALRFDSNLFLENVEFSYVYAWNANRIFGDRGVLGTGTRDSTMDSHFLNLKYSPAAWARLVGFIYLLQFDDVRTNPGLATNNSATYGGRLQLTHAFTENLKVGMVGSLAYQQDYERVAAVSSYGAWYFWYEASLQYVPVAKLSVAWEQLGSDGGNFQFRTPLATLHKFNGFADTFLAGAAFQNGGVRGLRDYMVTLAPRLPFGLAGFARYHFYTTDQGSARIGWEIEGVLKRRLYKGLGILAKGAYFESDASGGAVSPFDRWRFSVQLDFAI